MKRAGPKISKVVERIHQKGHKGAFVITGGATQSISWLTAVPGASNSVLEVRVPYAYGSLSDMLGKDIKKSSNRETAVMLATAAFQRAALLSPLGSKIIGVSATCGLVTNRPKRGSHRMFAADSKPLDFCGMSLYIFVYLFMF